MGLTYGVAVTPALALTLFPTRIVLDESTRAAQLQIINNGDRPKRYVIEWRAMAMDGDGTLRLTDPSALDTPQASDYLISGPRQAIVPPGGYQVIRILSRLPPDAPDREYRSHLMISEPSMDETSPIPPGGEDGIAIEIETMVRTTIPVILRQGDLRGTLEPTRFWFERNAADGPILGVLFERQGARSINARATLTWAGNDGSETILTERRFATYTEIRQRRLIHRLPSLEEMDLEGGTIEYTLERLDQSGDPAGRIFRRTLNPLALPGSEAP
jgi:hypothetical protein